MKRHRGVRSVPPAVLMLGFLLSPCQVDAADFVPGPEATTSASTSHHANYHGNYHADYRTKGTEDQVKGTDDDVTPPRDERRYSPRDRRNAPGMDRHGQTGFGWPR